MGSISVFPPPILGDVLILCGALMFVVGSICFLPGPLENILLGDLLFILGSFIYLGKSCSVMIEQLKKSGLTLNLPAHELMEFSEHTFYFLSAIIFSVGCILWWPNIYRGDAARRADGLSAAAHLFVIGSLGFVVASMFSGMALSAEHIQHTLPGARGRAVYKLTLASLLFGQLGGVLFVAGSYMYRPQFDNHCERHQGWNDLVLLAHDRKSLAEKLANRLGSDTGTVLHLLPESSMCVNIGVYGTKMYILGSFFYVVQALFGVLMGLFRAQATKKKHEESSQEESSVTQEESTRGFEE